MASVAEEGGRYEEAEALCDQALEWYSAQGDRLNALSLKRTRTMVRMKRGQGFAETLSAELVALESEAADTGADAERTAILLVIAQVNLRRGHPCGAARGGGGRRHRGAWERSDLVDRRVQSAWHDADARQRAPRARDVSSGAGDRH